MSIAGTKLNWGISGSEGETDQSIIQEPSLVCYSGRQGGLNPTYEESYQFGGIQDQIDMNSGGYGVLINSPMKTPHLALESNQVDVEEAFYGVRIEYDIVTLTTAEQADLYQKALCG
ncbi:MAG: hypothetical protein KAH12_11965 [Anaerolineales bacterium]|nr:hypothetical protein [Anaerolineales bacterium]